MARPKYGISGWTSSLIRSTTSERDREFRVSTSGSPLGTNLVESQTFLSWHSHPVMYTTCEVCMYVVGCHHALSSRRKTEKMGRDPMQQADDIGPAIPNCLKILVIQPCSDLENAIWHMSTFRSVDLLTRYYGPQFNEMSIHYRPWQIDPMSVCGQYVAIIIDFACLPETELEQKREISKLGVMLNPNCPEPLILVSGVDHQNKPTKFNTLSSNILDFGLGVEVDGDIMIVTCVRAQGTMYTRGAGAKLEMHHVKWHKKREVRDTTMKRINEERYDKHELKNYLKRSILFKCDESNSDRLLGTLDVLAVPTRADFSADWVELHEYDYNKDTERPFYLFKSRRPFYILHAAAPNVGERSDKEPQDIKAFRSKERQFETPKYLHHYRKMMENVFNAVHFLEIQHLILHPFGMGAFIRNLHNWVDGDWQESDQRKEDLRLSMVTAMVEALNTNAPRPFLCHMCYPVNGESRENRNNEQAIGDAMTGHNNIILQPGVDALALANHIASMGFSVGMLNSANANRIGNHWDQNGAESAIDENIHRRSHMLCLTSALLNVNDKTLQQNVNRNDKTLQQNVIHYGGTVYDSSRVAMYLATA